MDKITRECKVTLKITLQHVTHKQRHAIMAFQRTISIDDGVDVAREYASRDGQIISRSHMMERALTNFAQQFADANGAKYEYDEIGIEQGWK